MKKLVRPFALGLSAALLVGQLSVHAETGSIEFKVLPPPASPPKTPNTTMKSSVWGCLHSVWGCLFARREGEQGSSTLIL